MRTPTSRSQTRTSYLRSCSSRSSSYPGIDPASGAVKSPTTDLPIARRVADPNDLIGVALLKFADAFIKNFDEIFPPHPR